MRSKRYSLCIKTIQIKFLNFFEKTLTDRLVWMYIFLCSRHWEIK
jgi:hypothetical protein